MTGAAHLALDAARSFLVFPGDDVRKREHARCSGADAIVHDLEDGVAIGQKDAARAELAAFVGSEGPAALIVRVNDPASEDGRRDLEAVAALTGVVLMVPKASPASVEAAAATGAPLLPLIEDAAALRDVHEIAAQAAVTRLVLGGVDLCASLGLTPSSDGTELLFARAQLVVASAAAGLPGPVDGPSVELHDMAVVEHETRVAASVGMKGRICIHPAQVPVVRRALAPSAAEVERARRVLEAWDAMGHTGVGVVDGALVERPTALRARATLDAALEVSDG